MLLSPGTNQEYQPKKKVKANEKKFCRLNVLEKALPFAHFHPNNMNFLPYRYIHTYFVKSKDDGEEKNGWLDEHKKSMKACKEAE